ncbi:MAG: hypothetical protein IJ535_02210 [Pseudobutyrivibrio sp.]|nr:hypothetical protein [Pseudobutyrivibrio sp.]MBQ8488573.1 hypothetical protein [Pseudobutyrivibrio sp.]
MHGEEIKYIREAYDTKWMSTVGANPNEVERLAAEKVRKWSTQAREAASWYQHEELVYNYRISNVIAGGTLGTDGKPFDIGADIFAKGLCLPSDNKMTLE